MYKLLALQGVMKRMSKPSITEIDRKALGELISRVEEAIKHELSLSVEDMKLLLLAISTLCNLQEKIEQNDVTLHKLRKLLGMVQSSERRQKDPSNDESDKNGDEKKKRKTSKPKKKKTKRAPPTIVHHKITDFARGQLCPACSIGKLYKFEPANLLRITGHDKFEVTQHVVEQLRCNACQMIYKAKLPESVLEDGGADQMYGYSARAIMVIDKFYSGLPYYHQENLSDTFGRPINASTIFDQCEKVANDVMPVFYELKKQAANAYQFLIDDTHHRILKQQAEWRDKPNGKGQALRSGVYCSGLIAQLDDGHEIILFETSLGHAGEHLDSILQYRQAGLAPPIVMCDALSSNTVTKTEVKVSHCNSHARRQFVEIESKYPDEVGWVLDTYALIWKADAVCKEKELNPEERLEYHQKNSLPAMEKIRTWCKEKLAADDFEENGGLGKAIKYFLKHYDRLIQFCVVPKALVDNNRMEEKLKIVIRGRKMAHFHQTANGAGVSNVLVSLLATANSDEKNIKYYLQALQKNADRVKESPASWLPWNYEKTLEKIKTETKTENEN
ncbi:MAG: transposase [Deltaproteobacteria bacterium CG11_big_fil_rev_8_21_14_0_20_45_16]|nr:MAG: transposase [Deltaproteobacteria bacterium CG11_big_fil_rev_8_21_14_0_20_45_16]